MRVFYIPDGHRRYADRTGCSIVEAYKLGYKALVEEIIDPLFDQRIVSELGIFLLSSLNIEKRDRSDLATLISEGEVFLSNLIEHCRDHASIETFGDYLPENLKIGSPKPNRLKLFLGTRCSDVTGCGEVDVFIRSGGELRLSGAPRELLGDYTQLYAVPTLHPEIQFDEIASLIDCYHHRYRREAG